MEDLWIWEWEKETEFSYLSGESMNSKKLRNTSLVEVTVGFGARKIPV